MRIESSNQLHALVRYLRAHVEATYADAAEHADVRAELIRRCSLGLYRYKRDRSGSDDWTSFALQASSLAPQVPLENDCEDLTGAWGAYALLTGHDPVEAVITLPRRSQEAHAYLLVGPGKSGLDFGIWDPSVWFGMRAPKQGFYLGDTTVRLRVRKD